jgi:peptide/nickel transport system ATP-binding protein
MRSVRGAKIAMVFQEPMTSLNPVLTIGRQMTEGLELHMGLTPAEARNRAADLLGMVAIPDAVRRLDDYPHQFSGGMRQRMMIAMALSCNPRIIIADEPTTALDVTTQAQLLELMKEMVTQSNASLVIVTHNLGIVARYAQRLYVMYAGQIVESGTSREIFGDPRHPYTIALLKCVPRIDEVEGAKLVPIMGMPPNLAHKPSTCVFRPRCPYSEQCRQKPWPHLKLIGGQHYVACHIDTKTGV